MGAIWSTGSWRFGWGLGILANCVEIKEIVLIGDWGWGWMICGVLVFILVLRPGCRVRLDQLFK